METIIDRKIVIDAPAAEVWKSLTDPGLMIKWMGEADFDLKITTTWKVGSLFSVQGFHHLPFENKGVVLEYVREQVLSYDFLSSLSRLPDTKEHHTIVRFTLTPLEQRTSLHLTITNFPTLTIYQHLNFYWNTTLVLLKKAIEMN
ncbi:SRPBCC domain-containing protein [Chitinophaga sp.]|uniref:SRPBCC family protein n=1 Tax=Chitinophaga sp. TaxID=1869181 RepID=UPI002F937499